jgi:hypothetical protein
MHFATSLRAVVWWGAHLRSRPSRIPLRLGWQLVEIEAVVWAAHLGRVLLIEDEQREVCAEANGEPGQQRRGRVEPTRLDLGDLTPREAAVERQLSAADAASAACLARGGGEVDGDVQSACFSGFDIGCLLRSALSARIGLCRTV